MHICIYSIAWQQHAKRVICKDDIKQGQQNYKQKYHCEQCKAKQTDLEHPLNFGFV